MSVMNNTSEHDLGQETVDVADAMVFDDGPRSTPKLVSVAQETQITGKETCLAACKALGAKFC